jgi:hypothetical protein
MTRLLRTALFMFLLLAVVTGCESKPHPEAAKRLTAAMQALKDKKIPAFAKHVLADQREKLDYDKKVFIDAKVRKAPLAQLMTMEYFSTFNSFTLSEEAGSDQTETTTAISVTFRYEDDAWGIFFVEMKKVDGEWFIDMKSSVEREYRVSGGSAFSTTKLVQ